MQDEELLNESINEGTTLVSKLGIFTNAEVAPILFSLLAGLVIFFLMDFSGVPKWIALPSGILCPLSVLLFVFIFIYGKPPHYADDRIEAMRYGERDIPGNFSHAPNGIFDGSVIMWDNGSWSCALELFVPSLAYARNADRNAQKLRLDAVIATLLKDNIRHQWFWSITGDYTRELAQYHAETETLPEGECKDYRISREKQFRALSSAQLLRRERLILFLSLKLSDSARPPSGVSVADHAAAIDELHKSAEFDATQLGARMASILHSVDIESRMLTAPEIAEVIREHWNPSYLLEPGAFGTVTQELSIQDQCWQSDITPSSTGSFALDGQHFAIFALKTPLPKNLYPGMIANLTKLSVKDYTICVNVVPRDRDRELAAEERALANENKRIAQGASDPSTLLAHAKRQELAFALADGRTTPVDMQYLIVMHAATPEQLQLKATGMKSALARLGTAYNLLMDTRNALNAFWQGTPGWLYGDRPRHSVKLLDKYLSYLIPLSSTYTGSLTNAEAIYNGEEGNLVGVKQFADAITTDSDPQHSLLFGKTGCGKSVEIADLIMQTKDFYEYQAIIDYGMSYGALMEKLGVKPVRLGASSSITINPYDTNGMPLTGDHLNAVAVLLRVMCGEIATDGMVMRYLKPFYLSHAEDWLRTHRGQERKLVAVAQLMQQHIADRSADDELEAWKMAQEEKESVTLTEEDVAKFLYTAPNREAVQMLAFSCLGRGEFPTHSLFVQYLRAKPLPDEQDFPTLQKLADALELWCAGGKNGRLFDGVTNIVLDGKIEYFELSNIPQNDPNFKFAAGALINTLVVRKIELMPRKAKKRLVIDEANSLLELPQGAQMVCNGYTKFRKHRCPVLLAMQQYDMLQNSEISRSVIGNVHQFLLMGQTDKTDVDALGVALELSNGVKDAVMAFETPANLPPDNRYSVFCQVLRTRNVVAGVGRNYMSSDQLKAIGL